MHYSLYFFIEKLAKRKRKSARVAAQEAFAEKRRADEAEANDAMVLDDDEDEDIMNTNIEEAEEDNEAAYANQGESCNCEEKMSSKLFVESQAQLEHYYRADEDFASCKASFDRLKKSKRFGKSVLDEVEKAMHQMLVGAETSELARAAAISPCRSWYYLLFMTALLIELRVNLNIDEIVFIIQSMLDFTFKGYGTDIDFISTHGAAWEEMVGDSKTKRSQSLVAARASLKKITPWVSTKVKEWHANRAL